MLLYFAGRPVAQLDISSGTESWKWLTVDHLGTPIATTGIGGALLWQGGFEPFGADWNGAAGAGVFLRLPGQWEEGAWGNASVGAGVYYNVYRWLQAGMGRYTISDPLGLSGGLNQYAYTQQRPILFSDRLGLQSTNSECCEGAFNQGLFIGRSGLEASGIVICCSGRKVVCVNPIRLGNSNPLFDKVHEPLLADCIMEHEAQHVFDIDCPSDCGVTRPGFRHSALQEESECAGSIAEVECLLKKGSSCGGNIRCLQMIYARIERISNYGRTFGRCPI